ncbi:MAG: lipoate--protein ligase, partial [Thermoplasmata archaeon]|nr:lipoate--protein ligase [Thermoplasmata archaeon]
ITITSFEDLIITLNELKSKGEKMFLGSCCEAFYEKHLEDFEEAGLPGFLIDIDSTTCYDLGREQDAYVGDFENLTELRLEVLKLILKNMK